MTNYNKWDKFDPDLVCREIEVQQTIDTSKRAKKKAFVEAATVNEQTVVAAKKAAEALQSQAEVAALKLKGAGGRRKREKAEQDGSTTKSGGEESVQVSSRPAPQQKSIAEKLSSVTDFLYNLLKQVELLRANTEKKETHAAGFSNAVRCLRDIRAFSHIKDATIQETLRAMDFASPAAASSSVKIMEDLDESESFLIEQTVNCLSLFALSAGELALAADTSRFVLKRQGGRADAGIWIMRGLAFAGIGVPFLARLHFTSALAANADYAGLQECLSIVEADSAAHTRRMSVVSKSELVCLELSRAVGGFFESRSHVLQGVADLAALTPTEVRNFLAEGSLWTRDPRTVFGCAAGVRVHDSDGKESLPVPPHTSRDCAIHMQDEAEAESAAVAVAAAVDVTVQDITAALRRLITECLNSKLAQHRNSPFNAVYANLKGDDRVSRAAVPSLLYIVRKLFYEAQIVYLEGFFQAAESKYCACLLLIQAARGLEPEADVALYLARVESVCCVNNAMCLIHRSPPRRRPVDPMRAACDPLNCAPPLTSVADLVGVNSPLFSALDWVDRGIALWPTCLPALWRRVLVLENLHRFSEALLQCDSLLEATTAAAAADTTAGEADSCTVVALKSSALSQSLSQQYLCGYTLQMPVPSVLASDCLELPSESYSEQTSRAKAAAAVKVGGGETGSGDALDFELLLSRATDSNSGVCFERIRNDRAVSLTEWRQKVNKQKSRLRFLLRKYGV